MRDAINVLVTRLADSVEKLWDAVFEPYKPERHYMRGPGPKWRAKHRSSSSESGVGSHVSAGRDDPRLWNCRYESAEGWGWPAAD